MMSNVFCFKVFQAKLLLELLTAKILGSGNLIRCSGCFSINTYTESLNEGMVSLNSILYVHNLAATAS